MINLLSPELKRIRRTEALISKVMFFGEIAFFLMVFTGGLMLAEVLYANSELSAQEERVQALVASEGARRISVMDQALRSLKADTDNLARLQEGHPETFVIILKLLGMLDPSAELKDVTVDAEKSTITFTGVAPTRASLIALKERLQGDPSYSNVTLPLESLLKERDIAFTFSFSFKR